MTYYVENLANPKWDARLNFGKHISWQYIDISIWDYDANNSNGVIVSPELYSVNPGHHNRELCDTETCNMKMIFSISLTDTCHCFSGGSCLPNNTCACAAGYGGPLCEFPRGTLRIFARNAQNLVNKDSGAAKSDAFLEIQAYDHHGGITRRYTNIVNNYLNPVWNEWVEFGVNEWSWFTVKAWDEDTTTMSGLSQVLTYLLLSFASVQEQQMKALGEGVIIFDYFFEP